MMNLLKGFEYIYFLSFRGWNVFDNQVNGMGSLFNKTIFNFYMFGMSMQDWAFH